VPEEKKLLLPKYLEFFLQCQYIFYLNLYFTKEGGSSAQGEPRQGSVEHSSWTLDSLLAVIGETLRQFKSRYFESSTKECFPATI